MTLLRVFFYFIQGHEILFGATASAVLEGTKVKFPSSPSTNFFIRNTLSHILGRLKVLCTVQEEPTDPSGAVVLHWWSLRTYFLFSLIIDVSQIYSTELKFIPQKTKALAHFLSCLVNKLELNCVSCKINSLHFLCKYTYFKIPF